MKHVMAIVLTLAAQIAAAQPAGNQAAAEAFFNEGNTHYNLGHFDKAAGSFMKAYEAWARPDFLYNIAQSYRLGEDCKRARFFYRRFVSAAEKEGQTLPAKKKAEVDQFISDLTECANKTDSAATAKPDTIVRPVGDPDVKPIPPTTPPPVKSAIPPALPSRASPTATSPPPPSPPTKPARPVAGFTATAHPEPEDDEQEDHVEARPANERPMIWARLTGGLAVIGAGDLGVPVQPVFGITAGYPLPLGPITIDLGGALSYTPLPYEVMGTQQRGTMFGVRALAAARYSVTSRISMCGELGLGVVSLSGLVDGNPITATRQAGSFMLPNMRVGVAADYAITPNVLATISPAFGYSPGASGMYAESMIEIDLVVGVGYVR